MAMVSVGLPVVGWWVSPIIDKVLEHGILHVNNKRRLGKSVQEEIDRMRRVLPLIKGVLEDAEQKQSENTSVLSWLGELKEVLYDAEDLLDQYEVDLALMNWRVAEMDWKAKVCGRFSSLFSLDISVAKQIKLVRERLDDLCKLGHELGLRKMATSTTPQGNNASLWKSRETTSLLADDSTVVGRTYEKSIIKDFLLSNDGGKKFLVLSIVGMGGVGKTTLTRIVFNDEDVKAFFKSRVWVCVGMSEDLDLKKIIIEIINSISDGRRSHEDHNQWSLDSLQRTLVKEIKDHEPFMLVLDDAWDIKVYIWDILLQLFKASGLTCRIIVTTRNWKVAKAIRWDRVEPIFLDFLQEEDMWSIFKRRAFYGNNADVNPELEVVGRHIIRRLKGLPLAAETISGILNGNNDVRYWRRISESRLLEVHHDENYMLPILMLSYNSLPVLLKQCFSYFSLFPKDYKFQTSSFSDNIFYQWMAHKFIQKQGVMDLEVSGVTIIQDLLQRSLLQYNTLDYHIIITIHDSIHDLAEMITKEEFLRVSDDTIKQLPKKLRHISFFYGEFYHSWKIRINEHVVGA